MQQQHLSQLTKELLQELGINEIGDIMTILQIAKKQRPPSNNCPSEIPQEEILSSLSRLDKQKGQIHMHYTCKEKDCHSLSDP